MTKMIEYFFNVKDEKVVLEDINRFGIDFTKPVQIRINDEVKSTL